MSSRRIQLRARTSRLRIRTVPTESLGNQSYVITAGGGGFVVDPPRDEWPLVNLARSHAIDIRYIVETPVHDDWLTAAGLATRPPAGSPPTTTKGTSP